MKELIKKLVETVGPSGYETAVRELVRAEIGSMADEIRVDALGNLIDNEVDSAVENIVGGGKFLGPIGTGVDAATVAAEGFVTVYKSTREQRDLADTILSGSTDEQDYATRRYFSPNNTPKPCPSGGSPCGR